MRFSSKASSLSFIEWYADPFALHEALETEHGRGCLPDGTQGFKDAF